MEHKTYIRPAKTMEKAPEGFRVFVGLDNEFKAWTSKQFAVFEENITTGKRQTVLYGFEATSRVEAQKSLDLLASEKGWKEA